MNSKEIRDRFFRQLGELAILGKTEPVRPTDRMAILFGIDEVVLDVAQKLVILPGMEPIPCDATDLQVPAEWYGLQKTEDGGWDLVVGYGDPYDPENPTSLPMRDGVVLATPGSMTLDSVGGTPDRKPNRAQRRAARRR